MNVGDRIFALRKKRGYSRRKLSEEAKVSESAIKQYETGKRQPKIEQLQLIADALDTTFYDLMGVSRANPVSPDDPSRISPTIPPSDMEHDALKQGLNDDFERLNLTGQKVAATRVNELTEIPRYSKVLEGGDPDAEA